MLGYVGNFCLTLSDVYGIFNVYVLDLQSDRLHKVLDFVSTVHDLCAVLGMDFFSTITEVHPSLNDSIGVQSKSISNETLSKLSEMVLALKEDKKKRLVKVIVASRQYITQMFVFMLESYDWFNCFVIVYVLDKSSLISRIYLSCTYLIRIVAVFVRCKPVAARQ